jgi:hypothetical protein
MRKPSWYFLCITKMSLFISHFSGRTCILIGSSAFFKTDCLTVVWDSSAIRPLFVRLAGAVGRHWKVHVNTSVNHVTKKWEIKGKKCITMHNKTFHNIARIHFWGKNLNWSSTSRNLKPAKCMHKKYQDGFRI